MERNSGETELPKKGSQSSRESADSKIRHITNKNIELIEDTFGYIVNKRGKQQLIQRFTWKNHNNIQAQIITYGARVISLKLPNRKRVPEDIVMGFDDITGYLFYSNLYMGATIGRVTDKVENSTFVIDEKQYWLKANDNNGHHYNGGVKGLDQVIWTPSVQGSKVVLSYVSQDLDEGYPGDLFVRVVFELTTENEFIIDIDAVTTKPTIVNLSNLLYFNLAGHGAGPEELYKHVVSINANCFLPLKDNGLPNGEILNVIYTENDYEIPKILNTEIGVNPGDGFDGHLCINRGIDQGICFMARALHPPSGRVLELYSNQYGLHFNTANHFGSGMVDIPVSLGSTSSQGSKDGGGSVIELFKNLHERIAQTASVDSKTNYTELKTLIRKLHGRKFAYEENEADAGIQEDQEESSKEHPEIESIVLNPLQAKYLEGMLEATKSGSVTSYSKLGNIIQEILDTATIKDPLEMHEKEEEVEIVKNEMELQEEEIQQEIELQKKTEDAELNRKGMIRLGNKIPSFYMDGRIYGKNNAIYKRHGAMCFQSENYPNAIYHKNFPSCILRPGETYKHTIAYKFWIKAGIPTKWIKRNFPKKTS